MNGSVIRYRLSPDSEEYRTIRLLDILGEGVEGTVFRAVADKFGTVAVKISKRSDEFTVGDAKVNDSGQWDDDSEGYVNNQLISAYTEYRISQLDLPRFILAKRFVFNPRLSELIKGKIPDHGVSEHISGILTIYELADGFSLQKLLGMCDREPLGTDTMISYCVDLIKILQDLLEHGIAHRDMHPGNFILSQGHLKLIDFGLTCFVVECGNQSEIFKEPTKLKDHNSDNDWKYRRGDVSGIEDVLIKMIDKISHRHRVSFTSLISLFARCKHLDRQFISQAFAECQHLGEIYR